MLKGFSTNWCLDSTGDVVVSGPQDTYYAQQAGGQIARIDLRLGSHHPTWDAQIVANYQAVLAAYQNAGLDIIGLLGPGILANDGGGQVAWNQNAKELTGSGSNAWISNYTAAVATVIAAFPSIHKWEVLNEPNAWQQQSVFSWTDASGVAHTTPAYSGGSYIYPSLFAAVLNGARAAIKAHNSSDTVITGGLLAHNNGGVLSAQNAGATYLDALYAAGGMNAGGWTTYTTPFDAVGLHLYLDQGGALVEEHLQQYLDYYLSSDVAHEGESRWKSLYVTELGWPTASTTGAFVSAPQQAANITAALRVLADQPYVKAALNYEIADNRGGAQYYGILDSAYNPKPSFTAFQQAQT